MQITSRDLVLKAIKRKEHLIEIIMYKTKTDRVKLKNTITVTRKDPIPFEVTNECIEEQVNLKTS